MNYLSLYIITLLFTIKIDDGNSVKFSKLTHNFGQIEERGGDVQCEFILHNRSNTPVVIERIESGCGCTTIKYNRKPIKSGISDTLKVTFDPRFRPGTFKKEITVYLSSEKEPTKLTISGFVE